MSSLLGFWLCTRLIDSLFGGCEGLHLGNQVVPGLLSRRCRLTLLLLSQVKIFYHV